MVEGDMCYGNSEWVCVEGQMTVLRSDMIC